MNIFTDRIIRAAKVDVNFYEEVEADKDAMRQAMGLLFFPAWPPGLGVSAPSDLAGYCSGPLPPLAGGMFGPGSPTSLARDSWQNRKPRPILANCCAPPAFRVHPA
ncbi:MAG: hypothetical protein PF495_12890 [Spirochaetales bacterium]|jgi:hypothetical protein|nr:hypothetical protein [Spirochaetales bacterium]